MSTVYILHIPVAVRISTFIGTTVTFALDLIYIYYLSADKIFHKVDICFHVPSEKSAKICTDSVASVQTVGFVWANERPVLV